MVLTTTGDASEGDSVTVTITATNPVDSAGVTQTFMAYVDAAPEVLAEDADSTTDDDQVKLRDLREGATRGS